jgi:hypothetical protein
MKDKVLKLTSYRYLDHVTREMTLLERKQTGWADFTSCDCLNFCTNYRVKRSILPPERESYKSALACAVQ